MGNTTNLSELKMALMALSDEDFMAILNGNPNVLEALGNRICSECRAVHGGKCPQPEDGTEECGEFSDARWIHRRNMGRLDGVFKEALSK